MPIMQTGFKTIVFLFAALLISGCASSLSGDVYTRDQAREAQTVQTGTIETVRQVQVEGTKTQIGTFVGGVLGGIGGSKLGGGRGSAVFAILGALGGGAAGAAAEEAITRREALEITIQLDSGSTISVVQAMDSRYTRPYYTGDRVRVMSSAKSTRVVHI